MLLQFTVKNFLSFKDEAFLNMIPAKSRIMKDHIIADSTGKKTEVLPLVTIYGANASGKTNLINALSFAKNFIINGVKSKDEVVKTTSFLLDKDTENQASRFEFVFKHEGIVYTYGFVVSNKLVHEEWLFAYFKTRESLVFERVTEGENVKVKFGTCLTSEAKKRTGFLEYVAQGTLPNKLFLTEAKGKNDLARLEPVNHWFNEHLHIIRPHTEYRALALRAHQDKDFLSYLSEFLRLADTGISRMISEAEKFDPDKHLSGFPDEARNDILSDMAKDNPKQIMFLQSPSWTGTIVKEDGSFKCLELKAEHLKNDGSAVNFATKNESDGTRRLMHLAPILQDIWARDRVLVIDELDRSLHTYLSRFFIQSCIAGVTGKNAKGQFILTTHDTNLLDRNLLRRDEIWFMEKDKKGGSHLTSLAEYKVSEGLNYENGYLNGRFGAIPFVGDTRKLLS